MTTAVMDLTQCGMSEHGCCRQQNGVMTMTLLEGEPAAGPWRALDTAELVDHVLQVAGQPLGRPQIVAVDGRGASGKSTLAAELKRAVARSAVVHTDDWPGMSRSSPGGICCARRSW